jgi:hypothetical protein
MTFVPSLFLPGTNVATFIQDGDSARYKCEANTFVPGGATTWYKCEVFVRVGWRRPRRVPVRGPMYQAVAPTGTNALICTGGKNTWYK